MIEKIKKIVEEESKKPTNPFGYTAFIHISNVVKFGSPLAVDLKADKEIVELACWLHDWGSLIGKYDDHHIVGANEAERILTEFNYPNNKIEEIKHCIITHRGSKDFKRETLEAEIVACADAMSHFADVPDLFHLAYVTHKLSYGEGKTFVKNKLERSWRKINLPRGKEIITPYYNAIKLILE